MNGETLGARTIAIAAERIFARKEKLSEAWSGFSIGELVLFFSRDADQRTIRAVNLGGLSVGV